jgi:surfactin synthase thioesterase subunit
VRGLTPPRQHPTAGDDAALWLRPVGDGRDAPVTLVCFPHAGGTAGYYLPVLRPLWPDADVLVVQYPGRGDRSAEPAEPNVVRLADRLAAVLDALPRRPTVFFGHSMGALIAFEVAVRLSQRGAGPRHLMVSGHAAPGREVVAERQDFEGHLLVEELRLLGGTDELVLRHPRLLEAFLPAIRNDLIAARTYRYEQAHTLDCPVTALIGDRDPRTDVHGARAWAGLTTGAFDLEVFAGGHFYLNEQRDAVLGALAARLMATLEPVVI